MYLIFSLFLFTLTGSGSSETKHDEINASINELRTEITSNCLKCYGGSQSKIKAAADQLETIIKETKSSELKSQAYEVLGDAYSELAGYTSDSKKTSSEYLEQRNFAYFQAYDLSQCKSPELIAKSFLNQTQLNSEEQLNRLKPTISSQQKLLFELKYIEGILLLQENEIEAGIQALELAVDLSSAAQAESSAEKIGELLFIHGKTEKAIKIMRLKYPAKTTDEDLLKMLKKH